MIIAWLLVPLLGIAAAWLLFRRMPQAIKAVPAKGAAASVSIIIPSRNEESNLPRLLASIRTGTIQPMELIVVDDHSTDATAAIARSFNAIVVSSKALPQGWTGKTWACQQGTQASRGNQLLFLDADTYFEREGLARLLAICASTSEYSAISMLPYHRVERPWEQFSIFFNLIMAAGAGGFSGLVAPGLFGQCLLIDRELYLTAGGHKSVRQHVLENLHLAPHIHTAGGTNIAGIGRGLLSMRMFDRDVDQLITGWQKGFAAGAANTPSATVWLISIWIAGAWIAAINLLAVCAVPSFASLLPGHAPLVAGAIYGAIALQLFALSRRIGTFRGWTSLLYPAFLAFYVAVFMRSVLARRSGRGSEWKGRRV